jgi:hypothetical protein
MASKYMVSLASRARAFRKSHIFLQQPQWPCQSVPPLALGSRSYSGGFLESWCEKFDLSPETIRVAIGYGISGFLGVGSTHKLVEFC